MSSNGLVDVSKWSVFVEAKKTHWELLLMEEILHQLISSLYIPGGAVWSPHSSKNPANTTCNNMQNHYTIKKHVKFRELAMKR